mgnify:CR=1 FL=1
MSRRACPADSRPLPLRLTATPGIHYDYAIVVPKVSPAYLKELKEREKKADAENDMLKFFGGKRKRKAAGGWSAWGGFLAAGWRLPGVSCLVLTRSGGGRKPPCPA